jgi:hypothetical protein
MGRLQLLPTPMTAFSLSSAVVATVTVETAEDEVAVVEVGSVAMASVAADVVDRGVVVDPAATLPSRRPRGHARVTYVGDED